MSAQQKSEKKCCAAISPVLQEGMQTEIPQEALDQMKREGWASLEEQKAYWEKRPLDFTEATCRWYDEWWQPSPDEERDAYINDSGGGSVEDL